jgi:REP element-mobilizing transposase RayT
MHIYQRTIDGFNIFYCLEDLIVFYTIVSVFARKYKVRLLGMCLMIDHTHLLAAGEELSELSRFVSAYTSRFVLDFNRYTGRKGPLFKKAYGSAIKIEPKKIRTAINYLFNNAVEKKLCIRAEDYMWNFLQFYNTEIKDRPAVLSRKLKRSMKIVKGCFMKREYLRYEILDTVYNKLSNSEKRILTEYIIKLYFPFAAEETIGYYKSFEEMITAINSNTGSEYEIREKHYGKTDVPYREIMACLKSMEIHDARTVITMKTNVKMQLADILKKKTSASYTQIRKFLQIKHIDKESESHKE